jgi:uncharacterized protein GlcG (DUF336 family)
MIGLPSKEYGWFATVMAGGVLIMIGNEIIGSVGVSGGTADEDDACAIEGIKAAGLEFKV